MTEATTLQTAEREFYHLHKSVVNLQFSSMHEVLVVSCHDAAESYKLHQKKDGVNHTKHITCFRCFFSSPASGSGRGGRISALVGAITCRPK